ncbi:TetR family transcriptional regulator [Planobispora takensis]|uniref:TetR family transcriptional regulator n=2 Tax=Planobispora takensis TaxID=1367882 RepID=A0A8J3WXT4_9ACTN|nr:TetR family transcriptional regulator [Planobispora takensis]
MIVAAALPLVAEYGAAVTTSRIARAAGIGEGTVFRVFADKDDLLRACMIEAMNPEHVLRELGSISLDDPLTDRLVQVAEALQAHLERMGTVIGALHVSGHRVRPSGDQSSADRSSDDQSSADRSSGGRPSGDRFDPGGREASMKATREAVTELIEPDRAALRLEPAKVAAVFLRMLFSRSHPASGETAISPRDLVDILLHGVAAAPGSAG